MIVEFDSFFIVRPLHGHGHGHGRSFAASIINITSIEEKHFKVQQYTLYVIKASTVVRAIQP